MHFAALHTAKPQQSQDEHEADYVGYMRVPVVADGRGWIAAPDWHLTHRPGDTVFPESSSPCGALTHYSVGENGAVRDVGPVEPAMTIYRGITPCMIWLPRTQ